MNTNIHGLELLFCLFILLISMTGCSSETSRQNTETTTESKMIQNENTTATSTMKEMDGEIGNHQQYYISVNRKTNCVTIYRKNKKTGNYTPFKSMICSVGRDDSTPLGTFPLQSERYKWHLLFGNVYGRYTVRITGNILFHSVPYREEDKDTLKWEEYEKLGQSASDGCVRLETEDAKWIFQNCKEGTIVKIFDGSKKDDPLGRPDKRKQIKFTAPKNYHKWYTSS